MNTSSLSEYINCGGKQVVNVADAIRDLDAVNMRTCASMIEKVLPHGLTEDDDWYVSIKNGYLCDVRWPVEDTDGVNKLYVDRKAPVSIQNPETGETVCSFGSSVRVTGIGEPQQDTDAVPFKTFLEQMYYLYCMLSPYPDDNLDFDEWKVKFEEIREKKKKEKRMICIDPPICIFAISDDDDVDDDDGKINDNKLNDNKTKEETEVLSGGSDGTTVSEVVLEEMSVDG